VDQLIGLNAEAHRLHHAGDISGLRTLLKQVREEMVADPAAAFRAIMDKAPDADREVMSDRHWQEQLEISIREALSQGIDGWADESVAIMRPWADVDLAEVRTSVVWMHAAGDANAPLSAAERLVAQLPDARLVRFGDDEGHFAPYHREGEILDELLTRG
jgi:pimeloyl-ACP methyl ester carboxylesterase